MSDRITHLCLTSFTLLMLAATPSAGEAIVITGVVREAFSKKGIGGVLVKAVSTATPPAAPVKAVASNAAGKYTITVPSADYELVYTKDGYVRNPTIEPVDRKTASPARDIVLFPMYGSEKEYIELVGEVQRAARERKDPQLYMRFWTEMETIGMPPTSRAFIARQLMKTEDFIDREDVPRLKAYATVDVDMLKQVEAEIGAAFADASKAIPPLEGKPNKQFIVDAAKVLLNDGSKSTENRLQFHLRTIKAWPNESAIANFRYDFRNRDTDTILKGDGQRLNG